jgi:hypothetical protein
MGHSEQSRITEFPYQQPAIQQEVYARDERCMALARRQNHSCAPSSLRFRVRNETKPASV